VIEVKCFKAIFFPYIPHLDCRT